MMDKNRLGFVINRFVIGAFVGAVLLIMLTAISIFQISVGASSTLLPPDIPTYYGAAAVVICGIIYASMERYKPTNTDVGYICEVMLAIMVLEVAIIAIILVPTLLLTKYTGGG